MAQINLGRFFSLPNLLKPLQLLFGILAMICVGAADVKPSGVGLIWFTLIGAMVLTLIAVIVFALELEQAIIPGRCISWPIVECAYTLVFAIFNFISVWLCVAGAEFPRSDINNQAAFTAAGFFIFANFLAYGFDFFLFLRIWMLENSGAFPSGHPGAMAGHPPSYGSP
uniref:MARVEL domain-containing protein n=1 Tax=Plectus sambesii TaxID=2011161 RepID=A0A914V164_9BILA